MISNSELRGRLVECLRNANPHIPDSVGAELYARSKPVTFSPGEWPIDHVANVKFVYFHAEGHLLAFDEDAIAFTSRESDFLGHAAALHGGDHRVTYEAITDCRMLRIPSSFVRRLADQSLEFKILLLLQRADRDERLNEFRRLHSQAHPVTGFLEVVRHLLVYIGPQADGVYRFNHTKINSMLASTLNGRSYVCIDRYLKEASVKPVVQCHRNRIIEVHDMRALDDLIEQEPWVKGTRQEGSSSVKLVSYQRSA